MKQTVTWNPPGKNCGLCGEEDCRSFLRRVIDNGDKVYADCPYYSPRTREKEKYSDDLLLAEYGRTDILQHPYDFVLSPLPGEISARKIVLPFRPDLVESLKIQTGDYVLGRPMGAGCPVPHILQVIEGDLVTGVLTTWVVGPKHAREGRVKDVKAYHMLGFEGMASCLRKMPEFGCRVTFLPGFCMMSLNHTGLVNMILEKEDGIHLRLEDIRILASK
ncbi:MAG TPA: (Fe-S)-binding protein [Bacillota bacterium]